MPTGAYQSVAGVGQQGRARIRNKGHTFALAQQAQHRILALLFIVVKKTQHPARGKAALAKQGGGAAGVFGQYQVGLGQHGPRPGRKVTRVAKGRGHDPETGGRQRHGGSAPGRGPRPGAGRRPSQNGRAGPRPRGP